MDPLTQDTESQIQQDPMKSVGQQPQEPMAVKPAVKPIGPPTRESMLEDVRAYVEHDPAQALFESMQSAFGDAAIEKGAEARGFWQNARYQFDQFGVALGDSVAHLGTFALKSAALVGSMNVLEPGTISERWTRTQADLKDAFTSAFGTEDPGVLDLVYGPFFSREELGGQTVSGNVDQLLKARLGSSAAFGEAAGVIASFATGPGALVGRGGSAAIRPFIQPVEKALAKRLARGAIEGIDPRIVGAAMRSGTPLSALAKLPEWAAQASRTQKIMSMGGRYLSDTMSTTASIVAQSYVMSKEDERNNAAMMALMTGPIVAPLAATGQKLAEKIMTGTLSKSQAKAIGSVYDDLVNGVIDPKMADEMIAAVGGAGGRKVAANAVSSAFEGTAFTWMTPHTWSDFGDWLDGDSEAGARLAASWAGSVAGIAVLKHSVPAELAPMFKKLRPDVNTLKLRAEAEGVTREEAQARANALSRKGNRAVTDLGRRAVLEKQLNEARQAGELESAKDASVIEATQKKLTALKSLGTKSALEQHLLDAKTNGDPIYGKTPAEIEAARQEAQDLLDQMVERKRIRNELVKKHADAIVEADRQRQDVELRRQIEARDNEGPVPVPQETNDFTRPRPEVMQDLLDRQRMESEGGRGDAVEQSINQVVAQFEWAVPVSFAPLRSRWEPKLEMDGGVTWSHPGSDSMHMSRDSGELALQLSPEHVKALAEAGRPVSGERLHGEEAVKAVDAMTLLSLLRTTRAEMTFERLGFRETVPGVWAHPNDPYYSQVGLDGKVITSDIYGTEIGRQELVAEGGIGQPDFTSDALGHIVGGLAAKRSVYPDPLVDGIIADAIVMAQHGDSSGARELRLFMTNAKASDIAPLWGHGQDEFLAMQLGSLASGTTNAEHALREIRAEEARMRLAEDAMTSEGGPALPEAEPTAPTPPKKKPRKRRSLSERVTGEAPKEANSPALMHGSPQKLKSLKAGSMLTDDPVWAAGYTTRDIGGLPQNESFTGAIHEVDWRPKNPAPAVTGTAHAAEKELLRLGEELGLSDTPGGLQALARAIHEKTGYDAIVANNADGKIRGMIPLVDVAVGKSRDPGAEIDAATARGEQVPENLVAARRRSVTESAEPPKVASRKQAAKVQKSVYDKLAQLEHLAEVADTAGNKEAAQEIRDAAASGELKQINAALKKHTTTAGSGIGVTTEAVVTGAKKAAGVARNVVDWAVTDRLETLRRIVDDEWSSVRFKRARSDQRTLIGEGQTNFAPAEKALKKMGRTASSVVEIDSVPTYRWKALAERRIEPANDYERTVADGIEKTLLTLWNHGDAAGFRRAQWDENLGDFVYKPLGSRDKAIVPRMQGADWEAVFSNEATRNRLWRWLIDHNGLRIPERGADGKVLMENGKPKLREMTEADMDARWVEKQVGPTTDTSERAAAFEFVREVKNFPDVFEGMHLLQANPFEAMKRLIHEQSGRLAAGREFGQDLPAKAKAAIENAEGITLPAGATAEMEAYQRKLAQAGASEEAINTASDLLVTLQGGAPHKMSAFFRAISPVEGLMRSSMTMFTGIHDIPAPIIQGTAYAGFTRMRRALTAMAKSPREVMLAAERAGSLFRNLGSHDFRETDSKLQSVADAISWFSTKTEHIKTSVFDRMALEMMADWGRGRVTGNDRDVLRDMLLFEPEQIAQLTSGKADEALQNQFRHEFVKLTTGRRTKVEGSQFIASPNLQATIRFGNWISGRLVEIGRAVRSVGPDRSAAQRARGMMRIATLAGGWAVAGVGTQLMAYIISDAFKGEAGWKRWLSDVSYSLPAMVGKGFFGQVAGGPISQTVNALSSNDARSWANLTSIPSYLWAIKEAWDAGTAAAPMGMARRLTGIPGADMAGRALSASGIVPAAMRDLGTTIGAAILGEDKRTLSDSRMVRNFDRAEGIEHPAFPREKSPEFYTAMAEVRQAIAANGDKPVGERVRLAVERASEALKASLQLSSEESVSATIRSFQLLDNKTPEQRIKLAEYANDEDQMRRIYAHDLAVREFANVVGKMHGEVQTPFTDDLHMAEQQAALGGADVWKGLVDRVVDDEVFRISEGAAFSSDIDRLSESMAAFPEQLTFLAPRQLRSISRPSDIATRARMLATVLRRRARERANDHRREDRR